MRRGAQLLSTPTPGSLRATRWIGASPIQSNPLLPVRLPCPRANTSAPPHAVQAATSMMVLMDGAGARASRPIQRRVTRRSPRHLMRRPQAWLSCGALHHLPRHRRLVPTTCLPHLLRPPPPGPHLSSRRPCPWLLPHCFRHTASAQPSARAAADRWRAYLCRRAGNKGRELLGGGDGRCVGDRCKCQDRILATERLNQ